MQYGRGVLPSFVLLSAIIISLALVVMFNWPLAKVTVVSTLQYQDKAELDQLVNQWLGRDLLSAPLEEFKAEVELLPWISSAALKVNWPDELQLDLIEHKPVASWNDHSLISDQSVVFGPVEQIATLPHLQGPEHSMDEVVERYVWFYQQFNRYDNPIASVTLTERGSWSISLRSGLEIRLGNKHLQQRTVRVKTMMTVLQHELNEIKYLDARYSNGVAVKKNEQEGNAS